MLFAIAELLAFDARLGIFVAGAIVGAMLALAFDHMVLPRITHHVWLRTHRAGRSRRRNA